MECSECKIILLYSVFVYLQIYVYIYVDTFFTVYHIFVSSFYTFPNFFVLSTPRSTSKFIFPVLSEKTILLYSCPLTFSLSLRKLRRPPFTRSRSRVLYVPRPTPQHKPSKFLIIQMAPHSPLLSHRLRIHHPSNRSGLVHPEQS